MGMMLSTLFISPNFSGIARFVMLSTGVLTNGDLYARAIRMIAMSRSRHSRSTRAKGHRDPPSRRCSAEGVGLF